MWKFIIRDHPILILIFINKALAWSYFPNCLREGRVFFLLKPEKDPLSVNSYRPICLLPLVGKILERLTVNRLNHWLFNHKILHPNQFGFLELKSCELATSTLISKARESRLKNNFSTIISLDIKAAFDNLRYNKLFEIFDKIKLPNHFKATITSYLTDRKNFCTENNITISNTIFKGAPQGSVIAPILWLLYINNISYNNDLYYIQAFADDLSIITYGKDRRQTEKNTNTLLTLLHRDLVDLGLEVAPQKSVVNYH